MAEHVITPKTYFKVFATLLVLTVMTTFVAFIDLHRFNVVVAIAIALTKALLVILYFMHVRFASRVTKVYVFVGMVWLGLLLVGVLHDILTRGWFPR